MKTEYNYSIESNIELQETNLNIANCKVAFFVNKNNFLSKIKLIVKGSILETEEIAHKSNKGNIQITG